MVVYQVELAEEDLQGCYQSVRQKPLGVLLQWLHLVLAVTTDLRTFHKLLQRGNAGSRDQVMPAASID